MRTLLELKELTKYFGGIVAVEDISLCVQKGEILGLIGPNGAGKTTVFNLITGVYRPTRGDILLEGESITGLMPDAIVRRGVARTFQNIRLFNNLTALENVVTALDLHHPKYNLAEALFCNPPFIDSKVKRGERELRALAREYLALTGLEAHAYDRASSLPYGLQRKLEIARALALKPKLLLLDEPAAGMNPEETMELCELIREIQQKLDLTVLVIEHHMHLVMRLCDRLYVINFGRELACGAPEAIQQDDSVRKAYLGGEKHGHA